MQLAGAWMMTAAALLSSSLRAQSDEDRKETVVVGGVTRELYYLKPASAPPNAPLLVVLHGFTGSAKQVREHSGFDVYAKRMGFVVAYPEGLEHRWADARQLTLAKTARLGTDDVGFLLAAIDRLAGKGLIDKERVYIAGHSNGAMMALTMACMHADRVKGIGVVAGNLARTQCNLSKPVAAIFFHGNEDPLIPFLGGGIGRNGARGFVSSAEETVEVFARKAGCQPKSARAPVDKFPADGTALFVHDSDGCSVPVVHVVIDKGGHGWPGHPPRVLKYTEEIDATRAIAELFFAGVAP